MPHSHQTLELFEKKINIKFKNKKLIEEALTHKSYAMEIGNCAFNERLEFLGDSILNTAITDFLFKKYPKDDEGKLSKMKSQLVAKPPLFKWAKEIKLGSFIRMSEGESITGGRERESTLANAMEALIGALFLDQGFEKAYQFIVKKYSQKKRFIETDYKSKLQEFIQKKYQIPPTYILIKETGPDHEKIFEMEVKIKKKFLGEGSGKSKKEAEQRAAYFALKSIKNGLLKNASEN